MFLGFLIFYNNGFIIFKCGHGVGTAAFECFKIGMASSPFKCWDSTYHIASGLGFLCGNLSSVYITCDFFLISDGVLPMISRRTLRKYEVEEKPHVSDICSIG